MFGDIASNNSRPTAGATAVKPAGPPPTGVSGYGVSSFGERPVTRPVQPQVTLQSSRPQPRPIAQASVAAPAPTVSPVVAQAATPAPAIEQAAVTPAPITSLPPVKVKKASKLPLVLTIIGTVVFIGGVAGLFIYALSGK